MSSNSLNINPIHLGLGATAQREPDFTGAMEWYEAYGHRHEKDGVEWRLVMSSFSDRAAIQIGMAKRP